MQKDRMAKKVNLTGTKLIGLTMCFVFGCWIVTLATFPTTHMLNYLNTSVFMNKSTSFGFSGVFSALLAGPLLLLVALALIYLQLSATNDTSKVGDKKKERGRRRVLFGTNPIVVRSWFGVLSSAEVLWIVAFTAIVIWMLANYMIHDFDEANRTISISKPSETLWGKKLKKTGFRLGFIGLVCLNLLFLPVSRGSVILRVLDIPFEHAIKYHVWLGNFVMTIFTLHGLSYCIAWFSEGCLIKLLDWKPYKVANFPGLIALLTGVTMWSTSIQWVRRKRFELFFYSHQLYILFIICVALHVGDFTFSAAFSGIFLFTFDRFLRFCQSRSTVEVLSTKLLPCGVFELVLAKPQGLKYHALSFVFLNVPRISSLQWHPYSVTSSPHDGNDQLKILVKPYGDWSLKLQDMVSQAVKPMPCPFSINVAVEGPYGHESDYFLWYESLILVAGGIGITPFIAILRDLLHRHQRQQPNLPRDLTLIWAVKKSKELQILDLVSPSSICPDYDMKLNLNVQLFVTQEEETEEAEAEPVISHEHRITQTSGFKDVQYSSKKSCILSSLYNLEASKKPVSNLVGTGSVFWVGLSLIASFIGYIIVRSFLDHCYYSHGRVSWSLQGFFSVVSLVLGTVVFGGTVIALWKRSVDQIKVVDSESTQRLIDVDNDSTILANECGDHLVFPSDTHIGQRPNLKGLFEMSTKQQRGSVSVGVLVCGPESLETSVAEVCQSLNSNHDKTHQVRFNYHSVSFDL
ncbi:unnamed protein product [Sphagnum compactum]